MSRSDPFKFVFVLVVLLFSLNHPLLAQAPLAAGAGGAKAGPGGDDTGTASGQSGSPHDILFVGNSLTFSQEGIYSHLEKLAASANPPVAIRTEKSVKGGATLKTLWEGKQALGLIGTGKYGVVVLQEDLPEINVDYFREFARRFVGEVRRAKSRPVLLMAWSYPRLGWISTEEIAKAHRAAGKELGVDVAPVGLAWQRSLRERPGLDLYVADREHPSIYGTYLATCVVYVTVFGKDPVGLRYAPAGVDEETAAYLQRIARETCQNWAKQE